MSTALFIYFEGLTTFIRTALLAKKTGGNKVAILIAPWTWCQTNTTASLVHAAHDYWLRQLGVHILLPLLPPPSMYSVQPSVFRNITV